MIRIFQIGNDEPGGVAEGLKASPRQDNSPAVLTGAGVLVRGFESLPHRDQLVGRGSRVAPRIREHAAPLPPVGRPA
jgi:hypothetical protein